jgi:hypothetical protein
MHQGALGRAELDRPRIVIYRVHYFDACDGSQGFSYHGSRRDAEQARAEYLRHLRPEDRHFAEIEIDALKTPKTKAQIIRLLSQVASHNDNG